MGRSPAGPWLKLPVASQRAVIAGARDTNPVSGLTHGFYKYPARFSPAFARAAVEAFTNPGDLVLDNHVGGGTTLVESLALGRHAIGIDISALAEFVTRVKTTVFSEVELDQLKVLGQARSQRHRRPQVGRTFHRICGTRLLQTPRPSLTLAPAEGDRTRPR